MIRVVQGHEKGIGLEVFLKSMLLLPQGTCDQVILYAFEDTLKSNLSFLNLPHEINEDSFSLLSKKINIKYVDKKEVPQSTAVLKSCLEDIEETDCLLTLPTSKDQLIINGQSTAGYTEFFRNYFKNNSISMLFKGPRDLSLLLTDHISLKNVTDTLSEEYITNKIQITLNGLNKYFLSPKKVIFAGINPHAGEGGILGSGEEEISKSISKLKKLFPKTDFIGPLPGDTLHFEELSPKSVLQVYTYHDQGLIRFKNDNGLFGLNISLGLPFLRLSVDHGTAFSLYGKNKADPNGCLFALKEAMKVVSHDNK